MNGLEAWGSKSCMAGGKIWPASNLSKLTSNWDQNISYKPKVRKCYVQQEYLCSQDCECHIIYVNMYFTDQDIMQRGNW